MRALTQLHVKFVNDNPIVNDWLLNRPVNTQLQYGSALRRFCEFASVTPEHFQKLPRKEARDVAWSYIKTLVMNPSVASIGVAALKSFYRNRDGEMLPFDSHKGGKHYFNNLRRKRVAYEHVPTKKEVYEIADMATNLRDRAMILVLFQSGIRVNALCSLKYGHVREQLDHDIIPLRLRITEDIDSKLRSYSIPFYDTFIGKEVVEVLKKYCEWEHRKSSDEVPLFLTRNGKEFETGHVWSNYKKCVKRAGLNAKTISLHSLRKAFRREVRTTNINQDYAEALMGHVLGRTRENYFNRNDSIEELKREYEKIDFSREGKTDKIEHISDKLQLMEREREVLKEKVKVSGDVTDSMWKVIDDLKKEIKELKSKH